MQVATALAEIDAPLDLTQDEPGVVLIENLAAVAGPARMLPLMRSFSDATQATLIECWRRVIEAIPLDSVPPREELNVAACAYTCMRAGSVADILEEQFLEGGNDPRNRGDLYLARQDRYFFNYTYLCGDFELSRDEAIHALRSLARAIEPTAQQFKLLGDRASFAELINTFAPLEGDRVPKILNELLPLVEVSFSDVPQHLPARLIRHLTVTAIARNHGFDLLSRELVELYELFTLQNVIGDDRGLLLDYLENLYVFEPEKDAEIEGPSRVWQKHWKGLQRRLGPKKLSKVLLALLPIYEQFSDMLAEEPIARQTVAWQAASLEHDVAAKWIIKMTTLNGERSPILASTLLHREMPAGALRLLAEHWSDRTGLVPLQSDWSRAFTNLVLRRAIMRQRRWLLDRLTDLYLRGGGYEAGESREVIEVVLGKLFDEMELSDEEEQELEASELSFDLLLEDCNVFTGEQIDASRWASPTSAYKYVRTILRLEDRGVDYLASLVSERRVITIEKILRQLDFHTSVQQIVACVSAFGENPADALALLLELRDSDGERPDEVWLERVSKLLSSLSPKLACDLLWELYRWDNGDTHSLNPGIFWALRLVPAPASVARLAKAATEMVRRKPSFAVAALDTLDAISTRGALSAILQMRRRIRNRKVLKLINHTIDRIADEEGLDRDVFLDYAVDTGDLERDASRLFDFGSHRVTLKLELDGRLSTTVLDAKGRQLRSFPKTAKDADPKLYKAFQATKKLLVETVSYQTRRLEQAMVDTRIWRGKDFLEIFGEHPVMAHLGRRLLWCTLNKKNGPKTIFTPTLEAPIDSRGRVVKISPNDSITILHPLHLTEKLQASWCERFDGSKIDQPFAQIGREVYRPLPSECETQQTQRLIGLKTRTQELYRVVKERGWSTDGGGPWEVGNTTHSYRSYPAAAQMVHLDTDTLGYDKQLTILNIRFTTEAARDEALVINKVNPIAYSEAFRDLMLCFDEEKKKQ